MALPLLRTFKHGFVLLITLFLMLGILSVQAQNDVTPEPPLAETPTLIPSPTEVLPEPSATPVTPTELPTDVPTVVVPTDLPTENASETPSLTPLETETPEVTPSAEPTDNLLATVEPSAEPMLLPMNAALPGAGEPLQAPTNLQISVDSTVVSVTWTDTNSDETTYEIDNGYGTVDHPLYTAWPDLNIWIDTRTINCGTTVWYRVRAVRGDEKGPYSDWVSTTTAPCASTCPGISQTTQRINVGSMGQYQTSQHYIYSFPHNSISDDGRYVLFSSDNPLTADHAAERSAEAPYPYITDLYRYDRQTCTTIKVSVGDSEQETKKVLVRGLITDDGRKAFFVTDETGLTSSPYTGLFMRDIELGTTTAYVSLSEPAILHDVTEDGRYVLLSLSAPAIGLPDGNGSNRDAVVYDTQTNTFTPVSVNSAGTSFGNDASWGISVFSDNGSLYVVFSSFANNLVPNDTNQREDVFLRNLTTGTTTRLSVDNNNAQFSYDSRADGYGVKDGQLSVVFLLRQTSLVLYRRTVSLTTPATGTTDIVSRDTGVNGDVANGTILSASLSQDGRWLAFLSDATNLDEGHVNPGFDVYIRDLLTSTTWYYPQPTPGMTNYGTYRFMQISPDGKSLLYISRENPTIASDINYLCEWDEQDYDPTDEGIHFDYNDNCEDLFLAANPFWSPEPQPPLQAPGNVQIALNGTTVQITWDDTNDIESYYEIEHGQDAAFYPIFSAGPNSTSWSETRSVCGATYWYRVRAVRTDTYENGPWSEWVSVTTPPCVPTCPTGDLPQRVSVGTMEQYQTSGVSSQAFYKNTMSTDGRYVLFSSTDPLTDDYAAELSVEPNAPGNSEYQRVSDVYRYDRQTCTTVKVTLGDAEQETVKEVDRGLMTDDGNKVFFVTDETGLVAQSYSGRFLFMRDIAAGTTTRYPLTAANIFPIDSTPDGRYVLFGTYDVIGSLPDNNNGNMDVYVYDTQSNNLIPVSVNVAGTEMANGHKSARFIFTYEGALYVLFESNSSNLIVGDTNQRSDIFLRNVTAGITTRISMITNQFWFSDSSELDGFAVRDGNLAIVFRVGLSGTKLYQRMVTMADPTKGYTQVVARASGIDGAEANGSVEKAALSRDGRWLLFTAYANNLDPADTSTNYSFFIRDLFTYTTWVYPDEVAGPKYYNDFEAIDFSPDGSTILYHGRSNPTLASDTNNLCEFDNADSDPSANGYQYDYDENCEDIFTVRNPFFTTDVPPATPTLTPSPIPSNTPAFTPTGEATLELTLEPTLEPTLELTVPPGTATHQAAMTQTAVAACNSMAVGPVKPIRLETSSPALSARISSDTGISYNGRYILYSTSEPQTPTIQDLYRYDTQTCTSIKVSVGDSENETTATAIYGALSDDGSLAVFASSSPNLTNEVYTGTHVFVRNIAQGTTHRIPFNGTLTANQSITPLDITADSRYVLFEAGFPGITFNKPYIYDLQTGTYVLNDSNLAPWSKSSHLFVANGKFYILQVQDTAGLAYFTVMLYNATDNIITPLGVHDDETPFYSTGLYTGGMSGLALGSNTLSVVFIGKDQDANQPSRAYVRTVNLSSPDVGTTTLVSRLSGPEGTILDRILGASISNDGRWVTFNDGALTGSTTTAYVRDLLMNTTQTLVAPSEDAFSVGFSGDSKRILFASTSDTLDNDGVACGDGNPGTYDSACRDHFIMANPLYSTTQPTPLAAPTGIGPDDQGSIVIDRLPHYSWSAVANATGYDLEVSKTNSFASPFKTYHATGTGQHPNGPVIVGQFWWVPGDLLPLGQYWWRVRARGTGNIVSPWSQVGSFEVNTALSPLPNALFEAAPGAQQALVSFKWFDGRYNNEMYQVQVSTNPNFSPVHSSCGPQVSAICSMQLPVGTYYWRPALVVNGVVQPAVTGLKFTVSEAAPPALKPVTPANGAAVLAAQLPVTLSWGWAGLPPSGNPTLTYEVELDTSATFNTPGLIRLSNLPDMTASPDLLDATYYWHVRAVNAAGLPGPWSATFSFTIDTSDPGIPSLLTPADNVLITTARPGFTWSKVSDAATYVLEIGDVCGGTVVYSSDRLATLAHAIPATESALKEGTYQACVTAYDKNGNSSGASEPRTFTVKMALAPLDGALLPAALKPVFTWRTAPGKPGEVVSYKVLIDTEDTFTAPYTYESPALAAIVGAHVGPLLAPGQYYWKLVRTVNGVADVPTIPTTRTFAIGAPTAGPALVDPTLNEIVTGPTTLDWDDATGPLGTSVNGYEVVVSRAATFAAPVARAIVENVTTYDFTPLPNQNRLLHYWRVRGLWDGVPVTQWSSRTFLVDNVAPARPVVALPLNNALLDTLRPLIRWSIVPTAINYTIAINDPATSTDVVPETPVTSVSYVPTVNLPQTPLTIRVRANDGYNSSAWTYVMITPRLGNTPAQNAVVLTGQPVFGWGAVPDATGYTLQIDNDPYFDAGDAVALGGDGTVLRTLDAGSGVSYTLSVTEALPTQDVYYWRVKPNTGDYPTGTASRSFAWVDAAGLKPGNLLTKPNNESQSSADLFNQYVTNIVFDWDAATPAPLSYQLQISNTALFPSVGTLHYTATQSVLFVPTSALTEGRKYWRVRGVYSADASSFGPWSDVRSFVLDRTAPPPPLINAPVISTISSVRPLFKWFAAPQATRYWLEVKDQNGIVQLTPPFDAVVLSGISYTSPIALNQNNTHGYQWTVKSIDLAENHSGPSLTRTLYIFSGISPTKGQRLTTLTPTFKWTGVTGAGAAFWLVEVARDAAMTDIVYQSDDLPTTAISHTVPADRALVPGLYFWRVYRVTEDNTTIQGQPFYVGASTSITPRPLSPAPASWINAAQLTAGALFSWNAQMPGSPSINTAPLSYEFQLSRSATFAAGTVVFTQNVTGTTLTLTNPTLPSRPFPDGTYYWRVRARYAGDFFGSYSVPYTVRIDQTAPSKPALLTPVDGAVITNTRTPLVTWSSAGGATQFIVEVAFNESFTSLAQTKPVGSLLRSTTLSSLINGVYYWRVVAVDAAGNRVPSASRRMTIAAP